MRRSQLPLLGLVATTFASCFAGPHQLRRSVDDWDHRTYVASPWLDVGLWVVPVIPLMKIGAFVGDTLVGDPIAFWGGDAWDGNGTGFQHDCIGAERWSESLLLERSRWTRYEEHDVQPTDHRTDDLPK